MIYFDNAATYINDNSEVITCFANTLKEFPANPNSQYYLAFQTNKQIEQCRISILNLLNLSNDYEVIFNSSASEGINHALKGYCLKNKGRGNKIIVFKNEHSSVINTCKFLESIGFQVVYINPIHNGEINYEEIKNNIDKNTILVSAMSVNNEVGSINDLNKIYDIIKPFPKCVLFSDVTQSIGKIKINYSKLDMFSFSAHKFGGLIGSGVLVKKKKIQLLNLIDGGHQEFGLRAGTQSLPLIKSTTLALNKVIKNLNLNYEKILQIKKYLIEELNKVDEVVINSFFEFPYILNFSLKSKKASVVIEALSNEKIYVSSLSSCDSKMNSISYVLTNMGKEKKLAENSIRLSFSDINTIEEAKIFIDTFNKIIKEIR